MKETSTSLGHTLVLLLVAACGGTTTSLDRHDAGAADGTASGQQAGCGGSGEPCCNETACNAGLSCETGMCIESAGPASDSGSTSGSSSGSAGTSSGGSGGDLDASGADAEADASPVDSPSDTGCAPGTSSCAGPQPLLCAVAGVWQSFGSPCSGAKPACLAGACVACNPGSAQCNGHQPEACDTTGTWRTSATCPYLCTGAGMCTGSCVPGTIQCSGTTAVESCDSTGTWQVSSPCPTGGYCYTGRCVTPSDSGGQTVDAGDCASKIWVDPVFDCPLQGCQTGPNYHCM